jgi:hypothetical protein
LYNKSIRYYLCRPKRDSLWKTLLKTKIKKFQKKLARIKIFITFAAAFEATVLGVEIRETKFIEILIQNVVRCNKIVTCKRF